MKEVTADIISVEPSLILPGSPEGPGISSPVKNYRQVEYIEDGVANWTYLPPGKTVLVPGGSFPDDLDTTSLALTALQPTSSETVSSVLDTMAEYVNDDGTFQVSYQQITGAARGTSIEGTYEELPC